MLMSKQQRVKNPLVWRLEVWPAIDYKPLIINFYRATTRNRLCLESSLKHTGWSLPITGIPRDVPVPKMVMPFSLIKVKSDIFVPEVSSLPLLEQ
jgi:hypothetical protein